MQWDRSLFNERLPEGLRSIGRSTPREACERFSESLPSFVKQSADLVEGSCLTCVSISMAGDAIAGRIRLNPRATLRRGIDWVGGFGRALEHMMETACNGGSAFDN